MKLGIKRRKFLALLASTALLSQPASAAFNLFTVNAAASLPVWQDVLIGGGGFQRGLDINPDGTMVSQTDVYGAYVGNTVVGTVWQQAVTATSMPSSYSPSSNPYQFGGVTTIKTAPSNSSVIYMIYGPTDFLSSSRVLVSQNKGITWTDANFGNFQSDPNNGLFPQACQPRLAIDPLNPAICFVGTELEGLWFTTNGLSASPSWTQISANSFPTTTTNPGVSSMQFDPTSGVGGVTKRLIVGVAGSGLWVTADGGTTWTKISGSPTNPGYGAIGSDGTYYCTQSDTLKIWRLSTANVLTDITPDAQGYSNIVIDPNNPARGVAGRSGGFFNLCTNAINTGTPTWAGTNFSHSLNAGTGQPGWVQASNDSFLTDGGMLFDPFKTTSSSPNTIGTGSFTFPVTSGLNIKAGDLLRCSQTGNPANFILGTAAYSGTTLVVTETANGGSGTISAWTITKERIWFSYGCGVLYTDGILTTGIQQWWAQFAGIENLVINQIIWPPGGNPFAAAWDRPFWNFLGPNSYQAGYHPAYLTVGNPVIFGSSVDWAKSTPAFIVGIAADQSPNIYSGFSTDKGVSWTPFPTAPPIGPGGANGGAGTVAACDTQRIVIARNNNGGIYQTQNQGVTWTAGIGSPVGGFGTSGFNSFSYRVAADCVNIGTFYAWNDGGGGNSGLWISTDGGINWSLIWAGTITGDNGFLPQIKTVPNLGSISTAGHIFLTGGQANDLGSTHPQNVPLYRWTNGGSGGTAPSPVANVLEVITCGFGAPKPGGGGYPAIFIAGWVTQNGGVSYQYGIWRSDDNAVTWNVMIAYPTRGNIDPSGGGWIDAVTTIEGDPNNWGNCIVGFQGSSVVRFGPPAGY